jgi:hypothetical protein
MTNEEIIQKLRDDDHYYGSFGKNFVSNSDIDTLINNPFAYGQSKEKTVPMVIGGYFHTLILEPDKVDKFRIVESSTRNTNVYKQISEGEICLLQHEADMVQRMRDVILANDLVKFMIQGNQDDFNLIEYEVPGIKEIDGVMFKGKADIINKDQGLIVDLKTTSDLSNFRRSAYKYNYDSQAYIYKHIFDLDMVFVAIDKTTHMLGIYDCSDNFLMSGKDKVEKAIANYKLFVDDKDFDKDQYIINETL